MNYHREGSYTLLACSDPEEKGQDKGQKRDVAQGERRQKHSKKSVKEPEDPLISLPSAGRFGPQMVLVEIKITNTNIEKCLISPSTQIKIKRTLS